MDTTTLVSIALVCVGLLLLFVGFVAGYAACMHVGMRQQRTRGWIDAHRANADKLHEGRQWTWGTREQLDGR